MRGTDEVGDEGGVIVVEAGVGGVWGEMGKDSLMDLFY